MSDKNNLRSSGMVTRSRSRQGVLTKPAALPQVPSLITKPRVSKRKSSTKSVGKVSKVSPIPLPKTGVPKKATGERESLKNALMNPAPRSSSPEPIIPPPNPDILDPRDIMYHGLPQPDDPYNPEEVVVEKIIKACVNLIDSRLSYLYLPKTFFESWTTYRLLYPRIIINLFHEVIGSRHLEFPNRICLSKLLIDEFWGLQPQYKFDPVLVKARSNTFKLDSLAIADIMNMTQEEFEDPLTGFGMEAVVTMCEFFLRKYLVNGNPFGPVLQENAIFDLQCLLHAVLEGLIFDSKVPNGFDLVKVLSGRLAMPVSENLCDFVSIPHGTHSYDSKLRYCKKYLGYLVTCSGGLDRNAQVPNADSNSNRFVNARGKKRLLEQGDTLQAAFGVDDFWGDM